MNVILGIILHAIGGLCAASFYIPIKQAKKWSLEWAWVIQGIFSCILVPVLVISITLPQEHSIIESFKLICNQQGKSVLMAMFFGALWGVGSNAYGFAMRFLGLSLGTSVLLGFCAIFGSLIPPIFHQTFSNLFSTASGLMTFSGIIITVLGIAIIGYAGTLKDKELHTTKSKAIVDFALKKGLAVALLSGAMSACFALGIDAGSPIRKLAVEQFGIQETYSNNPVFLIITTGGFCTNIVWYLIAKFNKKANKIILSFKQNVKNTLYAALGGVIWYFQFFFYGIGERHLGDKYAFASWSIHMAFIIIFSNIWGIIFKEWTDSKKFIKRILYVGLFILLMSVCIIGLASHI